MNTEIFFTDSRLPFVEGRHSPHNSKAFKPHMHQRFSVGAVRSGQVRLRAGRCSEVLAPGTLALINPETLHSCNTANNTERSFCMLYLDVQWCLQIQKSLWDVEEFIPTAGIRIEDPTLYAQYIDVMESLVMTLGSRGIRDRMGHAIFWVEKVSGLMLTAFGLYLPFS